MSIRIAFAAVALAALAGTAHAEPKWNGAGWYLVDLSIGGRFIASGPYASKEACDASASGDEYDVATCEYLSERPSWDD